MIKEVFKSNRGQAAIIVCDHCNKEARKPFKDVRDKTLHFCQKVCSLEAMKPGGCRHEWVVSRALKGKNAFFEKHGVKSPMQIPGVIEQFKKSHVERFGQERADAIALQTKTTNEQRYGVSCPFNIPRVRANACSLEAQEKKLKTLVSNGMWKISKVETEFGNELSNFFESSDIEPQVICHKWLIDFYIKSIDTFVQIDGVYWHGLNRNIDEIRKSTKPRDITILRKWVTDHEQNEWFSCENKRLFRFTDVEFRNAKRQNQVEQLLRDRGLISDGFNQSSVVGEFRGF